MQGQKPLVFTALPELHLFCPYIISMHYAAQRIIILLYRVKQLNCKIPTKSGIIVGMGESAVEIAQVLDDLRAAEVDFVTIGQYLRPSKNHWPVDRYVTPEEPRATRVYCNT